jgi:hypothetical protein
VRSFRSGAGGFADLKDWADLGNLGSITSFGVDSAGELYIVTIEGQVLKVVRG